MTTDENDPLFEPTLDRQWVYQGGFLWVEKLAVKLPDGRMALREIVHTRDSVAVLLVNEDRQVHLIRQFRIALNRSILEIPAGLIDEGESSTEAALRECEEEVGVRPRTLIPLTRYAHSEGFATGSMHLFLGLDLDVHGRQNLDANEFLEPMLLPYEELRAKVADGEIVDTKTILCTLLARDRLGG